MNQKKLILNTIRNQGWVTGIRRSILLFNLEQHHSIDLTTSDCIISQLLTEGLISINKERYKITITGIRFLKNKAQQNLRKKLSGRQVGLMGAMAAIVAIMLLAFYQLFFNVE